MHFFECQKKSQEILQKAHKKYDHFFEGTISDEGLEARYYLLEYLRWTFHYVWVLEKDGNGSPLPLIIKDKSYYWSISHSKNYIAYIVSENPVGIDIAEQEIRDTGLFDIHHDSEYRILGEKNWAAFYLLWTAKEAILKVHGGALDDMKDMKILQMSDDSISIFGFHEKIYTIKTHRKWSMILSYTYS